MLAWSGSMGGWFAFTIVNNDIDRVALVLAVGGLFGVIWLLGLMILALFLVGGE
jgi:hypothetical protein